MTVSFKNTIGFRLLRYVFACYFAVTVVVTSYQLFSEYIHVKEGVFEELSHLGETLEDSLAQSIWNYDFDQVESTLLGINKVAMVSGTKVTSMTGDLVVSVGQIGSKNNNIVVSEMEGAFGSGVIQKIEYEEGNGTATLFEYKFPIFAIDDVGANKDVIGYCYIYAEHSSIISRVQYGFILIIVNSLIKTIALWFIFLYFAKRIIAKPLGIMTEATEDLDPNNTNSLQHTEELNKISYAETHDELNILARSFLKMRHAIIEKIGVIEQQIEIIEQQNGELEQRVDERTATIKAVNTELKHLSLHDPLTDLPNRALFNDRFENMLKMARRERFSFAVAVVDCRKFKEINDNFGHQAGDYVLRHLAERLVGSVRDGDTVARMGGDEFAILLKDINEKNYQVAATEIVNSVYQPIIFEKQSIMAGINVGVSVYPSQADSAEVLYKNADMAMYQAKESNSDVLLYDANICEDIQRKDIIIKDLEAAIDANELELFYQPVVDVKANKIKGVEALLRWLHPEFGFISPEEFVAIAEGSNLIKKLTHWVIDRALIDGEKLMAQGYDLTMSINISGRLINDVTFPSNLSKLLDGRSFPRECIILELTESSAMRNPVHSLGILQELKEQGVRLSIDDFGTGYSSFSYLTKLPVDELKIDRSFLIEFNESSQLIIEAIIGLAHQLNLTVVAEGVETSTLVNVIEELGGDYLQGYYFSRALPLGDLTLWMHEFSNSLQGKKLIVEGA